MVSRYHARFRWGSGYHKCGISISLFTDAGFGSLTDGRSAENAVDVMGLSAKKGGYGATPARITRVARSSPEAEVLPTAGGIDLAHRRRLYLYDVLFGEVRRRHFPPIAPTMMQTPLGRDEETTQQECPGSERFRFCGLSGPMDLSRNYRPKTTWFAESSEG